MAGVITQGTSPVVGTVTNDNAVAGRVGEELKTVLASGSAVSLTTNTTANVTSVSLTAGDWEVSGVVDFTPGATTSLTQRTAGVSTTSATLGAQDSMSQTSVAANVPGANVISQVTPNVRISVAVTTPVYLVARALFTVSTLTAYGSIRARRVR